MGINGVEDFAAATNDLNEERRCLKKLKPLLGIGFVAVYALFFCIMNVIVKKLSHVCTDSAQKSQKIVSKSWFSLSCLTLPN